MIEQEHFRLIKFLKQIIYFLRRLRILSSKLFIQWNIPRLTHTLALRTLILIFNLLVRCLQLILRLQGQVSRELIPSVLLLLQNQLFTELPLLIYRSMILIGLVFFMRFILNTITAVINGCSFMLEGRRSNGLTVASWILCCHTLFSHIRHYLLVWCSILNSFVGHCLHYHCLLRIRSVILMDSSNEANHIFIWIRKAKVILNRFILNSFLASLVWWDRSVNFPRAASADIRASFTCRLDAFIVHSRLIDHVLHASLLNSKMWKTPITVTCGIELGILIRSKDFQKTWILFESISDLFWHLLI
jgi:hypothetical protein